VGGRAMRGFAWAGVISCCFWGFWATHAGLAWVPFAVVGGLCGAYLIFGGRRDKDGSRVLPSSLERLAYFSDETSVALAWKWRRGREGRLRILRSDTRAAQSPDDASNGQTCVFDGSGQTLVVDHDVLSRRTYHYSIFVEDGNGRWSDPIWQPVLTDAQAVRAAIETTRRSTGGVARGGGVAAPPPVFKREHYDQRDRGRSHRPDLFGRLGVRRRQAGRRLGGDQVDGVMITFPCSSSSIMWRRASRTSLR
jgi:hypothetical protein